ncbi:unnamed protein product [Zymoseptoria tritici ST99CH_1E4]|uniref:Uncharacterized protein n=1 Tax=Zymoseptoria tritici ST99CH_1E4 TaxID=1276532 RepID=A0A2H1GTZ7_ZYMTR|nr:unnamed protein product [Zymoseptoria tritici ST99CH_1E4]
MSTTSPQEELQWAIDYDTALKLYEDDQFLDAIRTAKQTLRNKHLGRYWQAEEIRLIAEDVYLAFKHGAYVGDEFTHLRLTGLRGHLDALQETQAANRPSARVELTEEAEDERDRSSEPDVVKILFKTIFDGPFYSGHVYDVDDDEEEDDESEGEKEERKADHRAFMKEFRTRALQKSQPKKRSVTPAGMGEEWDNTVGLRSASDGLQGSAGGGRGEAEEAWNSAVFTKRRRMHEAAVVEHASPKRRLVDVEAERSNVDEPGVCSSSDAFGLDEDKELNSIASILPNSLASPSVPQSLSVHRLSLAALVDDGQPLSDSHTPLLVVLVTDDFHVNRGREGRRTLTRLASLSLSKATGLIGRAFRSLTSARSLAGFKGQKIPTQATSTQVTPTQTIYNQATPTQATFKKSSAEKAFVAEPFITPTTAQLSPDKPSIAESPNGLATAQPSPEDPRDPRTDLDGNVNPYLEITGQLPMAGRLTSKRNLMQKTSKQMPATQKPAQKPARGPLSLDLFARPPK